VQWSGGARLRELAGGDAGGDAKYRTLAYAPPSSDERKEGAVVDSIAVDVERTCGELSFFSNGVDGSDDEEAGANTDVMPPGDGRQVLKRILLAYARTEPEVGYVQVPYCFSPNLTWTVPIYMIR
jgi:hypothetical protein